MLVGLRRFAPRQRDSQTRGGSSFFTRTAHGILQLVGTVDYPILNVPSTFGTQRPHKLSGFIVSLPIAARMRVREGPP